MPHFPTDSFYKFIAITGVAIIISVLYGYILLAKESKTIQQDTNNEIQILDLKNRKQNTKDNIEQLEYEIKESKRALAKYRSAANTEKSTEQFIERITQKTIETLESKKTQLNQQKATYKEIVTELNKANTLAMPPSSAEVILEHKNHYLTLSYLLIILGSLMSVSGFWNWFKYHQKPANQILMLQLKKESLELEKLDIEIEILLKNNNLNDYQKTTEN